MELQTILHFTRPFIVASDINDGVELLNYSFQMQVLRDVFYHFTQTVCGKVVYLVYEICI